MNFLVDTHALVWTWRAPELLSGRARAALTDPAATLWLRAASAYEIEIKRDRDADLAILPPDIEEAAREDGFFWLAIEAADMATAGALPRLHGDPWDRIILAQALLRGWIVVTADRRMADYADAPILW